VTGKSRIKPADFDLLHEALLFAREEFTDVNRLRWSNDEYRRLQEIIREIEARMKRESTDSV
jgi:DNA polymerase III delta subunit